METRADTTGNGGAHVDVGRHVVVSFNVGAKAWEDALEIVNTARIDKFPKTPWNETSCGFAPVMVPGFLSTFMHVSALWRSDRFSSDNKPESSRSAN